MPPPRAANGEQTAMLTPAKPVVKQRKTTALQLVAGGLRFARGDAELLANQRVEQRGFTHIGLANNRQATAALG